MRPDAGASGDDFWMSYGLDEFRSGRKFGEGFTKPPIETEPPFLVRIRTPRPQPKVPMPVVNKDAAGRNSHEYARHLSHRAPGQTVCC